MGLTRFPAGLLGALALVLAAEGFVARHPFHALDHDDWQYRLTRQTAADRARGRDVLCFGDSLVKTGVYPRVVEARSGLKVYNLAVCGSQAPASYYALRRALSGGARPSAVVVDFCPPLLALPVQTNTYHWPHLLGPLDALELGLSARDPGFLGNLLVRGALPSVRARQNLRSWLLTALAGVPHKVADEMPPVLRHWARHGGGQVMPASPGAGWNLDDHQKYVYPAGWRPDRVNVEYVRRFLALAASHRLTVYWLMTPVHPGVQERKERVGFDEKYLALVRDCRRRYPNVVVLDGRHAGYDPEVFFDPHHLGREGAYALSEDLGEILRRPAPRDRWATLPAYRPRGDVPPYEPVMAAIKPSLTERR